MELGNYKTKRNIPITDMKGKQIRGVVMREQILTIHSTKKTKIVHKIGDKLESHNVWMGQIKDPMNGWVQLVHDEETICEFTEEEWPEGKGYEVMMMEGAIPKVPRRRLADHNEHLKQKLGAILKRKRKASQKPALPERQKGFVRSATLNITSSEKSKKTKVGLIQRSFTDNYQIAEEDDDESSDDDYEPSPVSITLPTPRNHKAKSIPTLPKVFNRPPPRSRSRHTAAKPPTRNQNKMRTRPAAPDRSLSPRQPPPPVSSSHSPVFPAHLSDASDSLSSQGSSHRSRNASREEDPEKLPDHEMTDMDDCWSRSVSRTRSIRIYPSYASDISILSDQESFSSKQEIMGASDTAIKIQNVDAGETSVLKNPPEQIILAGESATKTSEQTLAAGSSKTPRKSPRRSLFRLGSIQKLGTLSREESNADDSNKSQDFLSSFDSRTRETSYEEINVYARSSLSADEPPQSDSDSSISKETFQKDPHVVEKVAAETTDSSVAKVGHKEPELSRNSSRPPPPPRGVMERGTSVKRKRAPPPSTPRSSIFRPAPPPRPSIHKTASLITKSSPKPPPPRNSIMNDPALKFTQRKNFPDPPERTDENANSEPDALLEPVKSEIGSVEEEHIQSSHAVVAEKGKLDSSPPDFVAEESVDSIQKPDNGVPEVPIQTVHESVAMPETPKESKQRIDGLDEISQKGDLLVQTVDEPVVMPEEPDEPLQRIDSFDEPSEILEQATENVIDDKQSDTTMSDSINHETTPEEPVADFQKEADEPSLMDAPTDIEVSPNHFDTENKADAPIVDISKEVDAQEEVSIEKVAAPIGIPKKADAFVQKEISIEKAVAPADLPKESVASAAEDLPKKLENPPLKPQRRKRNHFSKPKPVTSRPQENLRRKLDNQYLDSIEKAYPDESGKLSVEVSSKKFGGKLVVNFIENCLILKKVSSGGLAEKLGLQDGDVLVAVDGNTWDGSSLMLKKSWKKARTPFKAVFRRNS